MLTTFARHAEVPLKFVVCAGVGSLIAYLYGDLSAGVYAPFMTNSSHSELLLAISLTCTLVGPLIWCANYLNDTSTNVWVVARAAAVLLMGAVAVLSFEYWLLKTTGTYAKYRPFVMCGTFLFYAGMFFCVLMRCDADENIREQEHDVVQRSRLFWQGLYWVFALAMLSVIMIGYVLLSL